ncbi:unnamed protein product [Phytophthora fragariaefolia]|uniref:Unnamed protein product n=1 Tax=Phytophthora fragariaefolia TaxID=1490495 RepID=A0A9W7CS96_9STRA|nr:unnamed protein product [Phytophthora fragariaefolia]
MATHPTFYVGLLKPYRPASAAEPEGSTASPSTVGRRPPSPERTVPREPGQERESERQLEPLRGVRLASPSVIPGHTDYGSRQGAYPSLGAPLRRSPRFGNIGPAGGRLHHQGGRSAQATSTHGLADDRSPGGHPGDILEPLLVGLHFLDASAQRHHLSPLVVEENILENLDEFTFWDSEASG